VQLPHEVRPPSSDGAGGHIFKLRWATGTNASTSVGTTIGFDVSTDDSGSLSYTADYVRVHSEEWIVNDLGSAQSVQAFALKFHNLQAGATARIQGHTANSWGSPDINVTLTVTADVMIYFWSSAQSKRYWRYYVKDADNPDLYTEAGCIYLGPMFSPSVNLRRDYKKGTEDPSEILFSDGGQISSNQRTRYRTIDLVFEYINASDLASFEAMFMDRGLSLPLFFVKDRDLAASTALYSRFSKAIQVDHILMESLYMVRLMVEELH
jgi:hypothetical protein